MSKFMYSDLVLEVKARLNCTRNEASRYIDAVTSSMNACLARGQNMQVKTLGTLRVKVRKATTKKIKGTTVAIPEKPYITFRPIPETVRALERLLHGEVEPEPLPPASVPGAEPKPPAQD